jgi:hypothetical protein
MSQRYGTLGVEVQTQFHQRRFVPQLKRSLILRPMLLLRLIRGIPPHHFLSRTATDEPGSARESVALEPSSNSIFQVGASLIKGFHFTPSRHCRGTVVLIFMLYRLIVEQNQNTSWFGRHSIDCSAGDNFRQFLISWHVLLAGSACWRISAIKRVQLRHELALFSFP